MRVNDSTAGAIQGGPAGDAHKPRKIEAFHMHATSTKFTAESSGEHKVWLPDVGGGFGSAKHHANSGGATGFTWGTLDLCSGDTLDNHIHWLPWCVTTLRCEA